MVTSQTNQYLFASVATSTGLRLLPRFTSHSTQHIVLRTTLIPTSPISGIVPRIFVGNLPREVRYKSVALSYPPFQMQQKFTIMNIAALLC